MFGIPPSLGAEVRREEVGVARKASDVILLVSRVVTAISPVFAVLFFDDLWLIGSDLREIWVVSVWIPALMTLIPVLGPRRFLGIAGDDARWVLMSAMTAFFVAVRSTGALVESAMPDDGLFVLSQLLGLSGYVVVGLSFPWKKSARTWFAETFNPVHIVIASLAALVFLVMRQRDTFQFLFSPASISGPSALEYVFLAVLVSIGFMRTPWRQFAALPIASFSILSYIANVLFFGVTVRPWPNPVTFACCIALCFPWGAAADERRMTF